MLLADEINNELKEEYEHSESFKKLPIFVYVILLVVVAIPVFVLVFSRKPYAFVSSFDNLPEPVSSPFTGFTEYASLGKNFYINFYATYDVNGKVIAVKDFGGIANISNKLSPKDYVLGRGYMGVQENIDKFNRYDNTLDVVISADLKPGNEEWLSNHGGQNGLISNYSNNRLIPCDKKVRGMLNKIDEGDNVKIKGYLAQVTSDDGSFTWGPSCTEKGVGSGCDIIYVTDVLWLKELSS